MNLFLHDLQINCCFLLIVKPFLIISLDSQLGQNLLSLNLIHEVSFFIIFFDLSTLNIKEDELYSSSFLQIFLFLLIINLLDAQRVLITKSDTLPELQKLTKLFNLTTDQILNYDENNIPKEVIIEDKTAIEQMQLIQELEEEDKTIIFKMIDKMLTTKKFKDFFNKNISAL